ncbi:hypothetical protein [Microbacterium rhizomatis]|uniref:Uncharacterized protein n=1 Tax=Microbacterium rhizomatis TaxID=1631477 RepID=A0A5J5J0T9_9MICO|nr:hypothetical protein [Microbacterium rhizomatis]KAA9107957.1 hypothetical protein F6B43_11065 [Microbacterium rhizomatis]
MQIIEWWSKLDPEVQAWLVAHNGESVPPEVLDKIMAAGGSLMSNSWWVGEAGPAGFFLSDEAVDWIEAAANGESALTAD